MLRALIGGLAAFFVALPAFAWTVDERNELINQTNFVVDGRCSGTLIDVSERLILTNAHCVDHKIKIVERNERQDDGTVKKVKRERRLDVPVEQHSYADFERVGTAQYLTEIVAFEERKDLALLQMKSRDTPHSLASRLLPEELTMERGEVVWAVGNPGLMDASVTFGIISSLSRTFRFPWTGGESTPMIQFDATSTGGSSGGALYNDDGYLIGVPSAGRPGTDLNLAIPVHTVREFLADHGYAHVYETAEVQPMEREGDAGEAAD